MLLGIHPLMTFLPGFGPQMAMPLPVPMGNLPGHVVTQNQIFTGGLIAGMGLNSDAGLCGNITFFAEDAADAARGNSCPHMLRLFAVRPAGIPFVEPPGVLTNLERLLQADRWLTRGEELARAGHFAGAVDCFEQVHLLVPGTNLEARAGEHTREVLAKAYGTASESEPADEQSEPGPGAAPLSPAGGCAKCAKSAPSSESGCAHECCSKARTVVYPVADLLGRGKETRLDDLEELMNVIAATVEPKSWAENGGAGTMESYYRCRALVIRQTSAAHEQIAELLAGLREARALAGTDSSEPHRTRPTGRIAKAAPKNGCCDHCAKAKGSPGANDECPCEECCPGSVLTLPAAPPAADAGSVPHLELIIEGCTDQGPVANAPPRFRCTIGGACAEADAAADGLRWRWQIPLGPLTAVVRYEHRELNVGIGLSNQVPQNIEESENHEQ
jgi:hypothetical protein